MNAFSWNDYTIFFLTLAISTIIGLYFGLKKTEHGSAGEYMFGMKQMKVAPIVLSILTCQFSGVTMLGVPTDVYLQGIGYGLFILTIVLALWCSSTMVYPVFLDTNVGTPYEYLGLRFNKTVYLVSSFISIVVRISIVPIIVYTPALALAQCTGFNIHHVTPVLCTICIFYTTLGGLKGVVWTDSFQFFFMLASALAINYVGTVRGGGVIGVLASSARGGRLDINFDVNPTTHNTFWSTIFGMFFFWLYFYALDHCCVQKFLSLSDRKQCKRAHIFVTIIAALFMLQVVYSGLVIYALYGNCDPITLKKVSAPDQMLPYLVLEVTEGIPGLAGLFIAGVFNASLSSLSAYLNSTACLIYNDFIRTFFKIPGDNAGKILKMLVAGLGLLVIGLVYAIEQVDTVVPLTFTFYGVFSGVEAGVFALGMLVPFGNSKGALYGGLTSVLTLLWIMGGSFYYKAKKLLKPKFKTLTISGCFNETLSVADQRPVTSWRPFFVYRISHYYYPLIGFVIVLLVGIPISYLTKKSNSKLNRKLISPVMRWTLDEEECLEKECVPLRKQ